MAAAAALTLLTCGCDADGSSRSAPPEHPEKTCSPFYFVINGNCRTDEEILDLSECKKALDQLTQTICESFGTETNDENETADVTTREPPPFGYVNFTTANTTGNGPPYGCWRRHCHNDLQVEDFKENCGVEVNKYKAGINN